MTITEFIDSVPRFDSLSGIDQVLVVGWFLHTEQGCEAFDSAALRRTFREAHREGPDFSVYLPRMAAKKPPLLLKGRAGYRLNGSVRRDLDRKYGQAPSRVAVSRLLETLPDRVPDLAERTFLSEAINCYRVQAYRAATVMTWNLAFDHLVRWVLADADRLQRFNDAIVKKYPKMGLVIASADDFSEMKEFEVIEVLRVGRLVSKSVADILREKLVRRNIAAHPSAVVVTQHQADDTITDLVMNVVVPIV